MPDAAPRLPQQLPDAQPAYAPVAPAAVVAVGAAGLFVVLILVLLVFAYTGGTSLLVSELLVLPALAVVAAFVARRQIRASEGTRTGEQWAGAAWYVAVAGGCAFVAYLFGVQYTVRRDAAREFAAFAKYLEKADPADPNDPALAGAAFHTVTPGQRSATIKTADNFKAMQAEQRDVILALQVSDLGRVVARNRGAATVTVGSVQEWKTSASRIDCLMTGSLDTPEGRFPLAVPLAATFNPAKQRQWCVSREAGAYLSRTARPDLTPYGWCVDGVGEGVSAAARELFATLQQPGASALAYDAFVRPGGNRDAAAVLFTRMVGTTLPRASLAGSVAVAVPPAPPGMDADLAGRVFKLPDGSAPSPADLARFRELWTLPGRVTGSGGPQKGNPDTVPAITFPPDNVEVSFPAEFILSYEGQPPPTARGRVVFKLPPAEGAAFAAELARLREQGPTAARTAEPPAGLYDKLRVLPWRVDRVVSDLRRVEAPRAPRPGQGPDGV